MARASGSLLENATEAPTRKRKSVVIGYKTARGVMYNGMIEDFLKSPRAASYVGKVQLILTSPTVSLEYKKKPTGTDKEKRSATG